MSFYVYEHWRTDRNECFYVGKGAAGRAYDMRRRNNYHRAIQAKVSREGFAVEVRIVASGLEEAESYLLEIERIAFWRSCGVELANLSRGGRGGASGTVPSPERRALVSAKLKGHPVSEESRKKHSETYKKNFTEERREALKKRGLKNVEVFKKYRSLGPKASSKKVICVDDGLEFESASAAARHYNAAKSSVIELCLGKNFRKTVNGKVFKYVGGM